MQRLSRANTLWLAGYVMAMVAVVWLLVAARRQVLANLSRPEAQADWQRWKDDESQREADPDAPVRRRTPKAAEPPALVLMRDSFPAIVAMSLLTATMVYGFVVVTVRGGGRRKETGG